MKIKPSLLQRWHRELNKDFIVYIKKKRPSKFRSRNYIVALANNRDLFCSGKWGKNK